MIKFTKNGHTVIATKGTYEAIYKPLGYTIINNDKKTVDKSDDVFDTLMANKPETTQTSKSDKQENVKLTEKKSSEVKNQKDKE